MFPQHGGVPSFSMRINGPILALLILVLVSGSLLTLSFYMEASPGDVAAQNRFKLSLIATLMLSALIFLAGTGRWWHRHLWRRGNSQTHHRHRHRGDSRARHGRDSHGRRRYGS